MKVNLFFFLTACLSFCQTHFAQAQQDSLLGYASISEAYRNISMEKKKLSKDKEYIEPLEVKIIQEEVLEKGQALLEYFISDTNVCVFFISKNDFQKVVIPKDFPLEDWANLLIADLLKPNFAAADFKERNADFVKYSHLIHEKIFAPLHKFNLPERLLIKPDGILKKLPFEIFLTEAPTDATDFENHAYLFKNHKISYCHSTMTQQKMQQATTTLAPKLFMTFAPANVENVQDEAIAIYRKFGGDIYQLEAATPDILKTEAPLFQALYLPEICQSKMDKLPALNSELVVFSICEKVESPFDLVHQFSEKGAKSIVTNLWKTAAENRLDFLKNFYHHIYQRKDKDAALQRAKKDGLRWTSGVEGHPHFWAGEVVFGVSKSVDLQGFRYDLVLWGSLVLMLVFGVFFIDRNII